MAEAEPEAAGSDWETSKENIQPLSSGRKMSSLNHSLLKDKEYVDMDAETEGIIQ
jgi:hypothetical protein